MNGIEFSVFVFPPENDRFSIHCVTLTHLFHVLHCMQFQQRNPMLFLGRLNDMYIVQHCYELAYVAFFCSPSSCTLFHACTCIDGGKAQ